MDGDGDAAVPRVDEHEMRYRAGTSGLAGLGIPDDVSHWYCPCGQWRLTAVGKPHRLEGMNLTEAKASWRMHATEIHEARMREDPTHDRSSCWCCCMDCEMTEP